APPGTIEVSRKFGLPPLPASEIVLLSTLSDIKSREALRTLAMAFREHRPPAAATATRPRFRNSQGADNLSDA
ncbi:MAG: LysR family transcriptional regulator, partial [Mesorhizobium sp.]